MTAPIDLRFDTITQPADAMRAATKPRHVAIFPTATLVEIESTHHRTGGVVVPQTLVLDLRAVVRELGLASFLEAARLWKASAATNTALDTLAAPFDWVAMAFSKGPGAPGGWMARGIQ